MRKMINSNVLLLILSIFFLTVNCDIPETKVLDRNGVSYDIPSFQWEDLLDSSPLLKANISKFNNYYNSSMASKITGIPLYGTMTTTHFRIHQVHSTVRTIFKSAVIPDRLYIFISKDPFLLDKGIPPQNIPDQLKQVIREGYPVSIIYTKNIGPHRKLLPLLASKYTEDCIIVTFDDENKRMEELKWYLPSLLKYYAVSDKKSIVALKSRRIGYCDVAPFQTLTYNLWMGFPRQTIEMLILPTGTGSIMYKPSLLHPIVFSPALRNVTITADDIAFRLSSMVYNVPVVSGCKTSNFSSLIVFGEKCNYRKKKSAAASTPTAAKSPKRSLLPTFADEMFDDEYDDEDENEESESFDRALWVRERDDPKSLYLSFNLKQGNDRQWNSGVSYLQKLGLLNISSIVKNRLHEERKICFQKDNVTKEIMHRYKTQ